MARILANTSINNCMFIIKSSISLFLSSLQFRMQAQNASDTALYFARPGIPSKSLIVNWMSDVNIHGPKMMIAARIAAIFGTNVRVCSWIEVVA